MQPIEYHLRVLAGSPAYAGAAPTMEKAADRIEQLRNQLAEAQAALQDVQRTFDVTSEGHCGEPWREFKFWCERHAVAIKAAGEGM